MFIQENRTKLKLKAGLPAYGVLSTSDDPQLAELFGLAGFDYYMLDAEHGLLDPIQVVNVIRACESTNMTPVVRNDWEIYVSGKTYQEEIFNSDRAIYWGTGDVFNPEIRSELIDKGQKKYKLTVNLPALGGIVLK